MTLQLVATRECGLASLILAFESFLSRELLPCEMLADVILSNAFTILFGGIVDSHACFSKIEKRHGAQDPVLPLRHER
jgi:hypothetical protein